MTASEKVAAVLADWKTLKQAAEECGCAYNTLYQRLVRLKNPYVLEIKGNGHGKEYRIVTRPGPTDAVPELSGESAQA